MTTRNFALALIAGLSLAALGLAEVKAETIEVVAYRATACTATYMDAVAEDGTPTGAVTLTCPHRTEQVAAVRKL